MNVADVLWTDDLLGEFARELIQEKKYQFWDEDEDGNVLFKNDNVRLFMRDFLPHLGIYNLNLGRDNRGKQISKLVFKRGNRCEPLDIEDFQQIIQDIFYFMGAKGTEVSSHMIFHRTKIFDKNAVKSITQVRGKTPFRDVDGAAYRFFQNGWVTITKDGVSPLKQYGEIPDDKIVWNNSIIPRDYVDRKLDKAPTHFRDYVENLAKVLKNGEWVVDEKSHQRIKLAIGYLCHRHHIQSNRKFVLAVDKFFDAKRAKRKSSEGGTGKSMLFRLLKHVISYTELNGKEWSKSKYDKFALAPVTPATEIVHFVDAADDFDVERMFPLVTDDFHIRSMKENPFSIPAEVAPKIAISSNHPLKGEGNSFRRREFILEIGNYYHSLYTQHQLTPYEEHGYKHLGSNEWDETDWIEFHRFVFECISIYLANGLPKISGESDEYKKSKLINLIGDEDLVEYLLAKLKQYADTGEEEFNVFFYQETKSKFPELKVKDDVLWGWLVEVGIPFGLFVNKDKQGSTIKQRLGRKERLDRWIAKGLKDWKDINGKCPADNPEEARVQVFKVEKREPDVKQIHKKIDIGGDGGDVGISTNAA